MEHVGIHTTQGTNRSKECTSSGKD